MNPRAAVPMPVRGVAFVVVLTSLLGASIAAYNKDLPWQRTDAVDLVTRSAGLELNPLSDVKFQGVLVGRVESITSDGREARVRLAIDPERRVLIPANVDAVIVPKTLFGEKFVDLRAPRAHSVATRLAPGATIRQTERAAEVGEIFTLLAPLLQKIRPDQLNVTLTNLAAALSGRGERIAGTIEGVDAVLRTLDPQLPALIEDLRLVGQVGEGYADATEDLARVLDSTASISSQVLVPGERSFRDFLSSTLRASSATEELLDRNGRTLVRLTGSALGITRLLKEYATTVPCLVDALALGDRVASHVIGGRGPHVSLSVDLLMSASYYKADKDLPLGDNETALDRLPSWVPDWRPHCPEVAPWQLELEQAAPFSMPGIGGAKYEPSSTAAPAAASGGKVDPPAVAQAREGLARVLAAQRLGESGSALPGVAQLLVTPLVAAGLAEVP
ncbi:MAG: MlaD family protein [Propionibacteriales bacterium]|nr:MlaD family protein [Propionibacteriales bacterium]